MQLEFPHGTHLWQFKVLELPRRFHKIMRLLHAHFVVNRKNIEKLENENGVLIFYFIDSTSAQIERTLRSLIKVALCHYKEINKGSFLNKRSPLKF